MNQNISDIKELYQKAEVYISELQKNIADNRIVGRDTLKDISELLKQIINVQNKLSGEFQKLPEYLNELDSLTEKAEEKSEFQQNETESINYPDFPDNISFISTGNIKLQFLSKNAKKFSTKSFENYFMGTDIYITATVLCMTASMGFISIAMLERFLHNANKKAKEKGKRFMLNLSLYNTEQILGDLVRNGFVSFCTCEDSEGYCLTKTGHEIFSRESSKKLLYKYTLFMPITIMDIDFELAANSVLLKKYILCGGFFEVMNTDFISERIYFDTGIDIAVLYQTFNINGDVRRIMLVPLLFSNICERQTLSDIFKALEKNCDGFIYVFLTQNETELKIWSGYFKEFSKKSCFVFFNGSYNCFGEDKNSTDFVNTLLSAKEKEQEKPLSETECQEKYNIEKAIALLEEKRFPEALLLLKASADFSKPSERIYFAAAYAFNDPLMKCVYSADNVASILSDTYLSDFEADTVDGLKICSVLRLLFNPPKTEYYTLGGILEKAERCGLYNRIPEFKSLSSEIKSFIQQYGTGLTMFSQNNFREFLQIDEKLDETKIKLTELSLTFNVYLRKKFNHPRVVRLVNELFGRQGRVSSVVEECIEGDTAGAEDLCKKLLSDVSGTENAANIRQTEAYINSVWEELEFSVGEKKNDTFKGTERNHLQSFVLFAGNIIYEYCRLSKEYENSDINKSMAVDYKRICAVMQSLSDKLSLPDANSNINYSAAECLKYTVNELLSEITAGYSGKKYFYVPFLKTGMIELDHNYLPDLKIWSMGEKAVPGFSLWERVLKHCEMKQVGWRKTLLGIFNGNRSENEGDDYGTAELIKNYLEKTNQLTEQIWPKSFNVEENCKYAELELKHKYSNLLQNIKEHAGNDMYIKLAEDAAAHASKTRNFGYAMRFIELLGNLSDKGDTVE